MRVGLICPYGFDAPGGVQNHVIGLSRWLAATGHEVSVLAPGGRPAALAPGVDFRSGGTSVAVRYNGSVARLGLTPRGVAAVEPWLARGDFDVVHLHEPLAPGPATAALARARSPLAATFHSASPQAAAHRISGRMLTRWLGRIDAPIAVSQEAARLAHTALHRVVEVIPNGVDAGALASPARPRQRWRGGARPRVLFLGRDEPRKGLDVFVAAVTRADFPDADVIVAGHPRRRLPPSVRALVDPDDATRNRLLATADVYVAPHLGRESFGLVLVEALAAGATVVASDIPAFRSVAPRDVVRLFPAGNTAALSAAVSDALRDPVPPAVAYAAAAHYDWSRVGPRIVAAYARIAGRGSLIA